MIHKATLYRAELYQDNTYPYTDVRAVWEANKDRYPGKKLIVTNGHWCEGVTPCPWYKVNGVWLARTSEWNCWGFTWSGFEAPLWAVSDAWDVSENFIGTIPVLRNGVREDWSNQTAGVKRLCNRTWWGFDAAGICTVETTTTGYTLDGIVERMEGLGVADGIVLDGSGSAQWYDGTTRLYGDGRRIYEFLLLWFDEEGDALTPPDTEGGAGKEEKMKIYLSPSSQPANKYAAGDANEQAQCNRIAEAAKTVLERCGFEVKKAPEGQSYQKNVVESNAWGAKLHIPIHTNAGGGRGPVVFVSALTTPRLKYAQPVYEALRALAPVPGSYGVRANPGLYECAYTTAMCIYCECAFHDNPEDAAFIVASAEALGEAVAKGLCEGAGAEYAEEPPEEPETPVEPETPGAVYRVQVGAFVNKSNAERLLAELKAKGFDGYIVTEKK